MSFPESWSAIFSALAAHVPVCLVLISSGIRGNIFYVIVDMRKDSETYLHWEGFELSETNGLMVYVPRMCAAGFQALTDEAQALYASTNKYSPADEKGIRYNDPTIGIVWPITENMFVSEKDTQWELVKKG